MISYGILVIGFGKEHLRLARVALGQKSLLEGVPVHVLTDQPPSVVRELPAGWTHTYFSGFTWRENRWVRTQANRWTPFDRTLFMDADQVVKKPGLRKFFELPGELVLNPALRWRPGDKVYRIYREVMETLKVQLPLTVYNGSLIRFDRGAVADALFSRWHENWVLAGRGRDMAPLACAVKQLRLNVTEVPAGWYAGSMVEERDAIIQHDFGPRFRLMYGLPRWPDNKPFDEGKAITDWEMVDL